ncbi:MAG: hypothetical protein AB7K24_29185, partial [Gemmataceae bacterium]
MMLRGLLLIFLLAGTVVAADREESVRYLRLLPAGKTASECVFTLKANEQGRSVVSVTTRGKSTMTVTANYSAANVLESASAVLDGKSVRAEVKAG